MRKVAVISIIFIVPLVLLLVLASVTPAAAAKGGNHSFNIAGRVVTSTVGTNPPVTGTMTGTITGTVTIHVVLANAIAKSTIGTDLTIQVNSTTVIYENTAEGQKMLTLADLTPGMGVRVKGTVAGGVFTAYRIVANQPLPHDNPQKPPKPPKINHGGKHK